jgi:prolipoprotein diacylglyceryltransferase
MKARIITLVFTVMALAAALAPVAQAAGRWGG